MLVQDQDIPEIGRRPNGRDTEHRIRPRGGQRDVPGGAGLVSPVRLLPAPLSRFKATVPSQTTGSQTATDPPGPGQIFHRHGRRPVSFLAGIVLGLRVLHQLQAGIGSQNDEAVK